MIGELANSLKKVFLIQTSNNVFVSPCIGTFPKDLTGDLNNPERVAFWRRGRGRREGEWEAC